MAGQKSLLSLFACALLPLAHAQSTWTVGQPVDTTSGRVFGTHAKNNSDISLYAGIPFAKPPVGDLRWASPQPYKNTSDYNATTFPGACPANSLASGGAVPALGAAGSSLAGQSAVNNLLSVGGFGGVSTEDCLYLNVWTKPQVGEEKKAVMVWFYGGGFQFGYSSAPVYNGEWFVKDQDVVLVTINYRTNVFGFPGLPGTSSAAQNPGLEDQRLAVEWVRDNIAAFHGDPDRITLFGESAGGASIDMYTYAYPDDPIAAATISTSGSVRSFFDPVKQNNTADWYNMSMALDCGGPSTSPDESLACLRSKSMDEILKATFIYDPLTAILGVFQPTSDEKVVFSDYKTRSKNGQFAKLPALYGNNNYEAGVFKFLAYDVQPPISDNSWDVFNLMVFTCPSMDAANARYNAGSPVWRFRYFGEFPNTRLIIAPNSGSYHVSEIPTVFQTTEEMSGAPNTANETIISHYMNTLWADFAKDPLAAMSSRNLPQYSPTEKSLIYFGVNNETEPWVVYPNNTDLSCGPLVPAIDMLGGVNALVGKPREFNAQYGSIADQLKGFVGIGDSNHADQPFGPPPIANVSAIPTVTPTVPGSNSTAPTGTGTRPAGTGVTSRPVSNTTVISSLTPRPTGTGVPPRNSTLPIGTGTGGFITTTRPACSGSVPTTGPAGGNSFPASYGGASSPAASYPPVSIPGYSMPPVGEPSISVPPVSLPSVGVPSISVPGGPEPSVGVPSISVPGGSEPSVGVPSISVPGGSVPSVSVPSISVPAISFPSVSGLPPPPSANATIPIGTGTGTGTITRPIVTGTGTSGMPSNSANSTIVDPPPATSRQPVPTTTTPPPPPPPSTYGGGAPSPRPTSSSPGYGGHGGSGGYGGFGGFGGNGGNGGFGGFGGLESWGKQFEAEFEKAGKDALAMFQKLHDEAELKKRVAEWAAKPDRVLRQVPPET